MNIIGRYGINRSFKEMFSIKNYCNYRFFLNVSNTIIKDLTSVCVLLNILFVYYIINIKINLKYIFIYIKKKRLSIDKSKIIVRKKTKQNLLVRSRRADESHFLLYLYKIVC